MSGPAPVVYALDTNVFIEAHRRYYALDLCPEFWECLVRQGSRWLASCVRHCPRSHGRDARGVRRKGQETGPAT